MGGWYDDILADSPASHGEKANTTKTVGERVAFKPSSFKKVDDKAQILAQKFQDYVEETFVTDSNKVLDGVKQTVLLYLLFLVGALRLAIINVRTFLWEPQCDQVYEVERVVVCGEKNFKDVTDEFCDLLDRHGGAVDMHPMELIEIAHVDTAMDPVGSAMSMAVTYVHGGSKYLITYSLEGSETVRFPPIKTGEVPIATNKQAVLSASFGRWFYSPDNADVTDVFAQLRGPEGDFYAQAAIPQHVWCIVQYLRSTGVHFEDSNHTKFLRVIYRDGRLLIFHPAAKGCILKSGVPNDRVAVEGEKEE
eukprot:jgi/Mesvir1/18599/Mv17108-RA.1